MRVSGDGSEGSGFRARVETSGPRYVPWTGWAGMTLKGSDSITIPPGAVMRSLIWVEGLMVRG